MSKKRFAAGAMLGAITGAVTGVVAGVLMAPKSGKETMVEAKAKAEVAKDQAADMVSDAKERFNGVKSDVKIEAEDLKARTMRAAEGAKKGFFSKK